MSLATSSSVNSPPHMEFPPAPAPKRAKSPPMAFERTSNDALAPRISPPFSYHNIDPFTSTSSSTHIMSPNGSAYTGSPDLQALVNKQANFIAHLHLTSDMERDLWRHEKEALHQRINQLEKLISTNNGHRCVPLKTFSYAKSNFVDKALARLNRLPCRRTMAAAASPHHQHPV